MAALSPSSSPRLPSPPPMAEDQLGPKSPLAANSEDQGKLGMMNDSHGASRRIRPGTKAADMAEGPPLVDLTEIDSAFQLTEHLKALHNAALHPIDSENVHPIDRQTAVRIAQPPEGVDKALWLYELCRFLCQRANSVLVALFADDPPCSAQTCPEMRASEWQYLCAVHDPPKSCCAIDYCCHTLDWAANILTSPKNFPSRLALGTEANTQHQQIRQLTNIFRRVYRIFAHAWFQHREMFWKMESKSGLYVLFKTVCDVYSLIQEENYTIPPEAEGIEDISDKLQERGRELKRQTTILKHEGPDWVEPQDKEEPETSSTLSALPGNTTKRHRQNPSTGAISVSTVIEENEEEESTEVTPKDAVPGSKEPAANIEDKAQEPVPDKQQEPEPEPTPEAKEVEEIPIQHSADEATSSSGPEGADEASQPEGESGGQVPPAQDDADRADAPAEVPEESVKEDKLVADETPSDPEISVPAMESDEAKKPAESTDAAVPEETSKSVED
ncbi:Mob1/phocein [Aulographum hederae CBS 113979]|uniref:Mob1/phocein n=1 Tax=Aulographum hederae CBS 113979 TaxID=1176131 RepID=A0A6G1H2R0_9PEZI|nr:Mob1/phocein [Aulographum hederae CBS 113979]